MVNYVWVLQFIFLVVCATNVYHIGYTAGSLPDLRPNDTTYPKLHLIGTVDGKSFFADMTRRNWRNSKNTCSSIGMRLASLTTLAQRALLLKAYNPEAFAWWFWTGGRDSQVASQLVWDGAGGTPDENVITPLRLYNGIKTCLAVNIESNETLNFDFDTCEFLCGVICEIYHGNS